METYKANNLKSVLRLLEGFGGIVPMRSPKGKLSYKNLIVHFRNGVVFMSYGSIIAVKLYYPEHIYLSNEFWDHSKTTGIYRNIFLGEDKKATTKKISRRHYTLFD